MIYETFKWIFVILIVLKSCGEARKTYCEKKYQCERGPHTVCTTGCKVRRNIIPMPPDFFFRNACIYWHNYYRNEVAMGKETRGGNGPASNMLAMSYDMELEYIMGCWLYYNGTLEHDRCRRTDRWRNTGQNLNFALNQNKPNTWQYIQNNIIPFYDEAKDTTKEIIDSFEMPETPMIGHFTQLVWAKSKYIGCARTMKKYGTNTEYMFGCNYGPQGNLKPHEVYKRGPGASDCPDGLKKNPHFEGLCGEPDPWTPAMKAFGNPDLPNSNTKTSDSEALGKENVIYAIGVLSFLII